MIDANAIRNGIESEFNEEFDFEAFDNYINDFFVTKRRNHLEIGLDDDYRFKNTPNRILSFIGGAYQLYLDYQYSSKSEICLLCGKVSARPRI